MLGSTRLRRLGAIPLLLAFVGLVSFLFYASSNGKTTEKAGGGIINDSQTRAANSAAGGKRGLVLTFTEEELEISEPYSLESLLKPAVPFVIKGTKDRPVNPYWTESGRNALLTYLATIPSLTSPQHHIPTCTLSDFDLDRYAVLFHSHSRIYLAITLADNEAIIPNLIHSLTTLVPFIGPKWMFVSIVQKGELVESSARLLRLLTKVLEALNVRYSLSVHGGTAPMYGKVLPEWRSEAMQTLYNNTSFFDIVLFIEDIVFCLADALEVLYQHRLQGADMSCSIDWRAPGPVVHGYDILRSMGGHTYYKEEELHWYLDGATGEPPKLLTQHNDQEEWRRFTFLLPIQVMSCWNGITVIDARLFSSPYNIRFRGIAHYEAYLLSVDLWQKDIRRIQVVPRASVAHDPDWYEEYRYEKQERLISNPAQLEKMERIDWKPFPPLEVAYPSPERD